MSASHVFLCVQEKAMGNRPSEMMDREKAYIPELQISFMEHIAMPIYKCVQKVKASHSHSDHLALLYNPHDKFCTQKKSLD